jgi:hypothetical protein
MAVEDQGRLPLAQLSQEVKGLTVLPSNLTFNPDGLKTPLEIPDCLLDPVMGGDGYQILENGYGRLT